LLVDKMKGVQLPLFRDGEFGKWRKRFECIADVKQWTDDEKAKRLPTFLEGEAFELHASFAEKTRKSYADAARELQCVFSQRRPQALQEFDNLKMDAGKNARMYLLELRSLCQTCYPEFEEERREKLVHDRFLKGIPQQFRSHLISNPSLDNTTKIADVVDQLIAAQTTVSCQVTVQEKHVNEMKELQAEVQRLRITIGEMNRSRSSRSGASRFEFPRNANGGGRAVQCFKCQRFGHIARFCTAVAGNASGMSSRSDGRL
jgi:hypothetical protein